ncbi:hypothetical protein IQ249_24350 [Lusitaniella coriacea LEGE 07157]|uniref:Uncharacterized protein n=1 Tax=Lusitaniella coriacea LEGE 07157 TaxID=945747 RepID=A0A8J7JFU7_9CYAN|nr:hypothetical protein [Lusitaniella coriacea]MBE9119025.1 hypothetical protein [Lusitaniella coriacea LEGE 07157]
MESVDTPLQSIDKLEKIVLDIATVRERQVRRKLKICSTENWYNPTLQLNLVADLWVNQHERASLQQLGLGCVLP